MYLCSWSGGKDSTLACYRAIKKGYAVSGLMNLISHDYKRVRFHGTEAFMIGLQAGLAGIPLFQEATTPEGYEEEFKEAVRKRQTGGLCPSDIKIKGMVFGDIFVDEHRQWVERVCGELDIEAVEPLWGEDTEKLLLEFIDSGFEAVIVGGQKKFIDKNWMGKKVGRDFLRYAKGRPDMDVCGEKGEYHTFVTGGPLFKGKIEIARSSVADRDEYWQLDIKDYRVL